MAEQNETIPEYFDTLGELIRRGMRVEQKIIADARKRLAEWEVQRNIHGTAIEEYRAKGIKAVSDWKDVSIDLTPAEKEDAEALADALDHHSKTQYDARDFASTLKVKYRWGRGDDVAAAAWLDRMKYLNSDVGSHIIHFTNMQWAQYVLFVINVGQVEADKLFSRRFKPTHQGVDKATQYLNDIGISAAPSDSICLERANDAWDAARVNAE